MLQYALILAAAAAEALDLGGQCVCGGTAAGRLPQQARQSAPGARQRCWQCFRPLLSLLKGQQITAMSATNPGCRESTTLMFWHIT